MHKNDMIATERRKRRKGLTLAEIIVVITLLGSTNHDPGHVERCAAVHGAV